MYSCSAEFKTIIDTVNDTDFLDEGMALVVEWVCDNFIKQLVSFCDVFLESKGEGEGEDKIKNLVANLKYFSARLKALGKDPKYPVDVVEPMMVKSLAVYWTHHKFAENASKPHWTAFNKAVQNFKSKKYTVSGQMKDLLRASLKLCHVGYLSHAEEVQKKTVDVVRDLENVIVDLEKICRGTRDGGCWLDNVPEDATLEVLLKKATAAGGLLSGPGSKVTQGKDTVDKAFLFISHEWS